MQKKNVFETLCTGCGLCKSVMGASFVDREGFPCISIENNKELLEFCKMHCPAAGLHVKENASPWGGYIQVYRCWAKDDEIRFKGASGGATTAIAIYLLESKLVDGVIQVGEDAEKPFSTKVYCNTTKEAVMGCTASRYITSSPLSTIMEYLGKGKKYAFVGRPCDVVTLNNFLTSHPQYKEDIFCTLSFFCAGSPSGRASERLVQQMGIDPSECTSIRYRGEGWPGKATATSADGTVQTMEYIDSWNRVLGRDVRRMCKYCSDGVGESADISSGDLWHLDANKKPIFTEAPGENITFARSQKGYEILQTALEKGYIVSEIYERIDQDLGYIQPYHSTRKALLRAKVSATKIMGRCAPYYPKRFLKKCSKKTSVKVQLRTYLGTVKRIVKKKL